MYITIRQTEAQSMRTQPQDIIARLEADNSKLAKQAILKEAMEEGLDEFFEGVRMALDPLVTFGVKKVPERSDVLTGQGLIWRDFKVLANQLINRELTGHAARDAIELVMSVATVEQWNGFYRRILIKDLRCGMSEKTVNKVAKDFPQYAVPVFTCSLAHDSANHEKKMVGKKQIEVKLDGVRVLAVCKSGKVELFSRNGKQFHNFPHIIKEIEADAKDFGDQRRTLMKQDERAVAEVKVIDEPVTVIVSQKGWVRVRQSHEHESQQFTFKAGDALYDTFECRTVDQMLGFGTDGRVYTVSVSELPGARGDGSPLTSFVNLAPGSQMVAYYAGHADDLVLISTKGGNGFLANVADMFTRNKAGKSFVGLDKKMLIF